MNAINEITDLWRTGKKKVTWIVYWNVCAVKKSVTQLEVWTMSGKI